MSRSGTLLRRLLVQAGVLCGSGVRRLAGRSLIAFGGLNVRLGKRFAGMRPEAEIYRGVTRGFRRVEPGKDVFRRLRQVTFRP